MNLKFAEWFLIFTLLYSLVWTFSEYIGFLICMLLGSISLGVLVISYLAEWIQKSKVPASYFSMMWAMTISAGIVLLFFTYLFADVLIPT